MRYACAARCLPQPFHPSLAAPRCSWSTTTSPCASLWRRSSTEPAGMPRPSPPRTASSRIPGSSRRAALLLDVSLPDLNGLDLQERLAADRDDIPIIFITGYSDVPMTVRAMTAGAMELLTKPFDHELLLAAIRQAIDRSTRLLDASETLRT